MKISTDKEVERIEKEAYEWLSVITSDSKNNEEVRQFERWLEANPRHRIVFDEINNLWNDMDELAQIVSDDTSPDIARVKSDSLYLLLVNFLKGKVKNNQPVLVGAMLVFLSIGIALTYKDISFYSQKVFEETYFTPQVATQIIDLPDGTSISLGAQSEIFVNYQKDKRYVSLIAGQAFFSVQKDPNRSFIVSYNNYEIQVIGTQFDVKLSGYGAGVSVLEGMVKISRINHDKTAGNNSPFVVEESVILTDNQKVETTPDGNFKEVEEITQAEPGAWRNGRLIYKNASLAEVLSDVDRYYKGRIFIIDDDLKDLHVSATFKIAHIDKMLGSLSSILPISSVTHPNGDIVLSIADDKRL